MGNVVIDQGFIDNLKSKIIQLIEYGKLSLPIVGFLLFLIIILILIQQIILNLLLIVP